MELEVKEKLQNILARIEEAACEEDQDGIISALDDILPSFWEDSDCYLRILETFFENVKSGMFVYPVEFIPEHFWKTIKNQKAYVLTLSEFYEDGGIDFNLCELLPMELLNDKDIVKPLLISNVDETFSYISDDLKAEPEIIIAALEGVQNKIEYRENDDSSWLPPFDAGECLEELINNIPNILSSNKDFILEFLDYDYFCDEFDLLYEWIDKKLWSNKEFVFDAYSKDHCSLNYVADKDIAFELLSKDKDAIEYLSEELWADNDFMRKVEKELKINI